eukprot:TRINITY_DN3197_c0_g1_i1.p1 TRINITY_DN3197_c0_g1~~TRINITY_DN3197_c0_g1_i1.p1  ORF type:complete len:463 (-),score=120.15 TRINITY_DN3197_c0_g1_i1:123-1511(-)
MTDWTVKNISFLALITSGYVIGEIAHFLIGTTSKDVANDVNYGDQVCLGRTNKTDGYDCKALETEEECDVTNREWKYNGQGADFQYLVGPAFIYTFSTSALIMGFALDKFNRPIIMSVGIMVFSISCILMGISNSFWQLIVLRMGIALGEAVCRPAASSLIAEVFSPDNRGVANGIFSWGVYFGYGMAYIFGIYLTDADILGYGWRASYVIGGAPGILIAVAIFFTVRDPRKKEEGAKSEDSKTAVVSYLKDSKTAFWQPAMILLLVSASVRQLAGLSWANNNVNYFEEYYPDKDVDYYWLTVCSIVGGSFGVVSGGFITDILQKKFGLHSRLWVQSGFLTLATPFAALTIYLEPPYCFISLALYYFCAETWFAILFTVIVEIVDPEVRSTCIAIFLFLMNLVGGNLPVIVSPLRSYFNDYRSALYLVWPGFLTISAVIFAVASLPLWLRDRRASKEYQVNK